MGEVTEPTAGTMIEGRYHLDARLGKGGMGEVWAATHTITRKRVAMKFLTTAAKAYPDLALRFLSEARAATAINHPSVVQILDVFEHDRLGPVIVMEMLVGETLADRLESAETLSVEAMAAALAPVASAVAAAHKLGIVHRDLKPENIFLAAREDGSDEAKVLDFGIAKLLEPESREGGAVTGTGMTLGTPCYMSPEQGFGEKDIDHRADIWSLGVVMYECLSGVMPIHGDNLGQFLKRLMNDAITPLEALNHELPAPITSLVGAC